MPSDQSTWLVAVPDTDGLIQEIRTKLPRSSHSSTGSDVAFLTIPPFKAGTLNLLIALSEDLPKQEHFFTASVAKTVDTLRNLLNNDPTKLAQHILVSEKSVDDYILRDWRWNEGRYGVQKSLREIVDTLVKEMTSLDNALRAKLESYNLAKASQVQMQRKKNGNLSVRSLADTVSKGDFIQDSEYLETALVAVPNSGTKEWITKYERLAPMVVPRSSRVIASDEEYTLFSAVIFKRARDAFAQKCRENKYIYREFVFSEEELAKQRAELEAVEITEKDLWRELLRLSRTNFSESFQILVHLKVVRLFVESVLRYGLPANYAGIAIKPELKYAKKTLSTLISHFAYLRPRSSAAKAQLGKITGAEDLASEYQSLMEQEFYDFVIFEIPWIVQ